MSFLNNSGLSLYDEKIKEYIKDNSCEAIEITKEEYDKLPETKYTDDIHYLITDYSEGGGGGGTTYNAGDGIAIDSESDTISLLIKEGSGLAFSPIDPEDEESAKALTVDLGDLDDKYLAKNNPAGTGSLSLNRAADTYVGLNSVAVGESTIASGYYAHAEGYKTTAAGSQSHAEGYASYAYGSGAHAEGSGIAKDDRAHAEGTGFASRYAAHAEGQSTSATYNASHAEGDRTYVLGGTGHAEGYQTTANGQGAHSEGSNTLANTTSAHAEGTNTKAYGHSSHAEGNQTQAGWIPYGTTPDGITMEDGDTNYVHAEGMLTKVYGRSAHGEGEETLNYGRFSHVEGKNSVTGALKTKNGKTYTDKDNGNAAHAEGWYTTAKGDYSHSEGYYTEAIGISAHAEGYNTKAYSNYAHTEGSDTEATGYAAHVEGYMNKAYGNYSHAEGFSTSALSSNTHAEGLNTYVTGECGHGEGQGAVVVAEAAHAEGNSTTAYGKYAHVEGNGNGVMGEAAHVGGSNSQATAKNSFAHGEHVQAVGENQFVIGQYNEVGTANVFVIGGGHAAQGEEEYDTRENIFSVGTDGAVTLTNNLTFPLADGTETSLRDMYSQTDGVLYHGEITEIEIDSPEIDEDILDSKGEVKKLVQTYTDAEQTEEVYPYTLTKAVSDEDGNTLDDILDTVPTFSVVGTPTVDAPTINADLLEGHNAAYFANQSQISALTSDISNKAVKQLIGSFGDVGQTLTFNIESGSWLFILSHPYRGVDVYFGFGEYTSNCYRIGGSTTLAESITFWGGVLTITSKEANPWVFGIKVN